MLNEATDCITSIIITDSKIITASLDGCVRHYDLRAGALTCDQIGPPIVHMCLTKDGQCMVIACADNVLRLVDNSSGELLASYKGHNASDFQIECGILANDSQIVSGSAEGSAVVWDLVDEKEMCRMKIGEPNNMINLEFSIKHIRFFFVRIRSGPFTIDASDQKRSGIRSTSRVPSVGNHRRLTIVIIKNP